MANDSKYRVLLSAFSCAPDSGSEPGNGWNWATQLAQRGLEVECLVHEKYRQFVEPAEIPEGLTFHFVHMPFHLEKKIGKSAIAMYLNYIAWQYLAYRLAKKIHRKNPFHVAHHVSWGSIQLGSFLYKLGIPFIFGPCGGGQRAPESLKKFFAGHWQTEEKREKVGSLLMKYSPASGKMLKNASSILVSNPETWAMVEQAGGRNIKFSLDATLPDSFYPREFKPKSIVSGKLKLLWVGRFMPRKGLPLVLEVMNSLKPHSGISLTIVGDGELMPYVKDLIEQYELGDTVTLAGMVSFEQVRGYFETHDVFFFTSLRDSGPTQLVEAMAFGLPVVTLNLNGQATIVQDSTGIRCPYETPEIAISSLKAAVLELASDPERVTAMSAAAYSFARENCWDVKVNRIIEEHYPRVKSPIS